MWHLKEVLVVAISYVILHYKNSNIMVLIKTIGVHLFAGIVLTFLVNFLLTGMGPVGVGGGFVQLKPLLDCAS